MILKFLCFSFLKDPTADFFGHRKCLPMHIRLRRLSNLTTTVAMSLKICRSSIRTWVDRHFPKKIRTEAISDFPSRTRKSRMRTWTKSTPTEQSKMNCSMHQGEFRARCHCSFKKNIITFWGNLRRCKS